VVMTWNHLRLFQLGKANYITVSSIVDRGGIGERNRRFFPGSFHRRDDGESYEWRKSKDNDKTIVNGPPRPTILSTLTALTLCPMKRDDREKSRWLQCPERGHSAAPDLKSAVDEHKWSDPRPDNQTNEGSTSRPSNSISKGRPAGLDLTKSTKKAIHEVSSVPVSCTFNLKTIHRLTCIADSRNRGVSRRSDTWIDPTELGFFSVHLGVDRHLTVSDHHAISFYRFAPHSVSGLTLKLGSGSDHYLGSGRLWDVFAGELLGLDHGGFRSPEGTTQYETDSIAVPSSFDSVNRDSTHSDMDHIDEDGTMTEEPSLTFLDRSESSDLLQIPRDVPIKVVVKFCCPNLFDEPEDEGHYTMEAAAQAILRESWMYEDALKPLQDRVVPRCHGLFRARVSWNDGKLVPAQPSDDADLMRGVFIYAMVLDRLGDSVGSGVIGPGER